MKLLAILLIFAATVHSSEAAGGKTSDRHQFAGARLKGELKKPEMSYIYQRKGLRSERIINVPENFNEEIIDGARQF